MQQQRLNLTASSQEPSQSSWTSQQQSIKKANNLTVPLLLVVILILLGSTFFFAYYYVQSLTTNLTDYNGPNQTSLALTTVGNQVESVLPDRGKSNQCKDGYKLTYYADISFCLPDSWNRTRFNTYGGGLIYQTAPFLDDEYNSRKVKPIFRVSDLPHFAFDSGAFCNADYDQVPLLQEQPLISNIRTVGTVLSGSHDGSIPFVCSDPIAMIVEVQVEHLTYYFEIGLDDVEELEQDNRLELFYQTINSIRIETSVPSQEDG